MHAFTVYIPP